MAKKILKGDEGLKYPRYQKKKGTHSRVKNPALLKKYAEDHPMCEINQCNSRRFQGPHHIIFRSQLGPDTNENLIALCSRHHSCAHGPHADVWRRICEGVKKGFG